MTLAGMLLGDRTGGPRASLENPAVPLSDAAILEVVGLKPAKSGVSVTETSALRHSGVWRAVNLISGTCGALPLHAYRKDGAQRFQLSDGPLARLLDDPHPDMTPFELWELMYGTLCLWGNAYFRKLRGPDQVVSELWWIHPDRVRVGRRKSDAAKVYVIDGDTENGYTDREILHIPGFGYDGVCGASPIRMAREGIGASLAAEEYASRLFGNSNLATGILQTEQRLTPDQAQEVKTTWKDTAPSGLESAHDVRVVGSGVKFHQLTIPPADAQFLESREFGVTEVARIFGLPPHLLAQVDKSTSWGTGIEQQNTALVVYTFRTWLVRTEQRFTKMARAPRIRGGLDGGRDYVRWGVEGLLRGDSAARAAFYTAMWQIGALSTNEVRALEDLGPVPGGDVRYRPLNMGALGEIEAPAGALADADSPAVAAAKVLQQAYLGVGKVITVPEARELLRQTGFQLDEKSAADVFADVPPSPAPVGANPEGAPA